MKKFLKVLGFVFLGFLVLFVGLAAIGTIGLKEARELTIGSVDLSTLEDGEYHGTYENFRWTNEVVVTIENHRITGILLTNKDEGDSQYFVYEEIIDAVIEEQKVDIDTVAGASTTTNSFLKAVENALNGSPS